MVRKLSLVLIVVLLTACGGKTPPPPRPTHIILEIEASGDINPNSEGRACPVSLRFYELRSISDFKSADFMALYEKDKSVLGGDLVRKQEIILQPNERKTLHLEVSDDTRAIGGFAAFRKYERGGWKGFAGVLAHETTVVHVRVGGTNLQMR
jgi:type VI secretion system protein VasD